MLNSIEKFKVTILHLNRDWNHCSTLSEVIALLDCRRNSSSGSVLIRQLTEPQLLTCSRIVDSAGNSVQ